MLFCTCVLVSSIPDLNAQDSNFPVTPELREKINGGNFSTFNVITMDPTIEGWFDMGNFCVEVRLLFSVFQLCVTA